MLCASRIVGVARLLFESGDYFVLHFRRCGDYSRATSDRVNVVSSLQTVGLMKRTSASTCCTTPLAQLYAFVVGRGSWQLQQLVMLTSEEGRLQLHLCPMRLLGHLPHNSPSMMRLAILESSM